MAHIANTLKVFNFVLEFNGITQFLIQTVEFPTQTVEVTLHGDANYDVGTPGRYKCGDMKLEAIKPAPGADRWAWDWFNAGQDPFLGGGALAGDVKRVGVLRELDSSQTVAVNSYRLDGCFVTEYAKNKFDRMSSDNVLDTITLHVDRMGQI